MKLTNFIIAMIVSVMFASIFALFLSSGAVTYGQNYDNTSLENYNKMAELVNIANETRSAEKITKDNSLFSILEGFFADAYNGLKTAAKSINIFFSLSDQAIQDLPAGESRYIFKAAAGGILVVLIMIGVLLAIIAKRDL